MTALDTLDAITAANSVLIEWIQSLPPDEAAAAVPYEMCLVMTYGHLTEAWTLHIVPRENDGFGADIVSYTCRLPDSVHTVGDIEAHLKSTEWLDTLFRMSQDYDAFHGPDPVNLD